MGYKRICSICNQEILYKTKSAYLKAERKKSYCKSCGHVLKNNNMIIDEYLRLRYEFINNKQMRNCPVCNKKIEYKNMSSYINAKKNNRECNSCKQTGLKNSNYGNPENRKGPDLYNIFIQKYGQDAADLKWKQRYEKHSKDMSGKNNPMYNKSVYNIWIERYGEDIANKKHEEWKKKVARPGKLNGMYGKKSPQGSGNGWSGHYKGYYFRSLLELSYLKYLLDNNIKFENGEKKKYYIEYKLGEIDRTYRPDYYLIDSQEFIEIKPKKLINNYENKLKFKAALIKHGNKFRILTEDNINKLSLEEIYNLRNIKDIIFDVRYELKFVEYYNKYLVKER